MDSHQMPLHQDTENIHSVAQSLRFFLEEQWALHTAILYNNPDSFVNGLQALNRHPLSGTIEPTINDIHAWNERTRQIYERWFALVDQLEQGALRQDILDQDGRK